MTSYYADKQVHQTHIMSVWQFALQLHVLVENYIKQLNFQVEKQFPG